jgi:hypothetical protein
MILQAGRDFYVHDKEKNQRKRTREKYNEKIIPSRFSCDDPVIILNPITQDTAALPQPHENGRPRQEYSNFQLISQKNSTHRQKLYLIEYYRALFKTTVALFLTNSTVDISGLFFS